MNLRADGSWEVILQSVDCLVTSYKASLVSQSAQPASASSTLPATSGLSGLSDESPSTRASSTSLSAVQIADLVFTSRERVETKNAIACKFTANSISEEQMAHCDHLTSAKDMWDTSKAIHTKGRSSRTMELLSILTAPFTGDIPFKVFVNKIKIAMVEFRTLGAPLPQWLFAGMLVRSLPSQYDSIVASLATEVNVVMDWEEFLPKLLMSIEMAQTRNANHSLAARMEVDDNPLVARITGTGPRDYSQVLCTRCKVIGHSRGFRGCPLRNKKKEPSDSSANVAAVGVDESALPGFRLIYPGAPPQFPWIVDSGAHVHCVGDKSVLSNFIEAPLRISTANESKVLSSGHGSVTSFTSFGCRVEIGKVYLMPGGECGFLSVDRLLEGMKYVVGPKNELIFSIASTPVLRTRPGPGFLLDAIHKVPGAPVTMVAATREHGSCTLMAAHRKLGHQSTESILQMVKSGAVTGLTLKDEKVLPCFSCIRAKSKRSPFSMISAEAPHTLYRVFIELGFVETPDRQGNTIYLAIVDQYSTCKWTQVLKDKKAETIIATWRVRSDNGKEFDNAWFRAYLQKQGIIVEITALYTPEQNGQVERLNGSLMGLVRAMLFDSGLPSSFWSDALSVATFVLNRRPHPRIPNKTAFELIAFVHVPNERRTKLAPRATQGVFIGYASEYNYRVWVASEKKVSTSRHITCVDAPEQSLVTGSPSPLPSAFASTPPPPAFASTGGGDVGDVPRDDENGPSDDDNPPAHNSEAIVPREGYAVVRVGPNPGRYENVDAANVLPEGSRRRPPPTEVPPVVAAIMAFVLDSPPMFEDKLSYDIYCAAVFNDEDIEIPKKFEEEAMKSPYRNHWVAAMASELLQFDHHGVFQEETWHEGIRVLGTIWVYSIKRDATGKIIRFKARLVAQGFAQRPGSTIMTPTLLLHLEQFDFDCAFLNGKMTEDVYVRYPKGWTGPQTPCKYLMLVGSMYGTKQAPREWYRAINDLMVARGYMRATADACLYIKHSGSSFAIITLYVDDGLIASNDQSFLDAELSSLHEVFKLKRLGPVSYFLGFEIHRTADYILVHQSKYIRTMLEKFDFASPSKRRAFTPMDDRPSLRIDNTPFPDVSMYQSANSCPTVDDWAAVKRIFRYLNSTVDWGIMYRNNSTTRVMVYSDASFADDPESRRSVGAYASMLAGGVVSWQSKQQSLVATSTTEAEILSASSATREAIWLRRLVGDVGIPQSGPTVIQEDNAACIQIAKDPVDHVRTKHFDIAHLFVRERVASGEVELEYCPTHVNAADLMTKGLEPQRFDQLRALLGMVSLVSLTGGSVRSRV
ncbi:BQ2448_2661 [Microbotryum intermedium]|uniref:BQ2448_2658 protein n=1 Tax=Microbotryum intermedium TaxID=269621 RepID=A0A238FC17_9BASI|nr:BQ2448_2658 [Microbotryum intermedium]SCV69641.1 BQ2448_2661 [Microbotryum intermedium]